MYGMHIIGVFCKSDLPHAVFAICTNGELRLKIFIPDDLIKLINELNKLRRQLRKCK